MCKYIGSKNLLGAPSLEGLALADRKNSLPNISVKLVRRVPALEAGGRWAEHRMETTGVVGELTKGTFKCR